MSSCVILFWEKIRHIKGMNSNYMNNFAILNRMVKNLLLEWVPVFVEIFQLIMVPSSKDSKRKNHGTEHT